MDENTQKRKNNPVRILVVGTGAVGGFYGCRLARAGAEVTTLHRSDYDHVRENGIHIDSIDGDMHFTPHRVIRHVADYRGAPDYILVCLKALPEISVSTIIAPAVGDATSIVLLQNGIDIEKPVKKAFPRNEIISGLAFICVNRVGAGRISHICYGRLTIGLYPGGVSEATRRLGKLFDQSATPCRVSEDIVLERWRKLLWNAPYNPISVLALADTAQIMARPAAVELVRGVMEEICAVADSAGHFLPPAAVEKNIDDTRRMKPYKTSMLLDYEARRPMEVEAILGKVIKVADDNGIDVTRMKTLYALLQLTVDRQGAN